MKRSRLPRTGFLRRTGQLQRVSKKRSREERRRAQVREEVFARDNFRCQFPHNQTPLPCVGALTVHHLLKASHGGAFEPSNLLSICAAANMWIEDHPLRARELGLVRLSWESSSTPTSGHSGPPTLPRSAAS